MVFRNRKNAFASGVLKKRRTDGDNLANELAYAAGENLQM